jgi:hypothetical protein
MAKFSELPRKLQESIYSVSCKSHDSGIECMREWTLERLTNLRKVFDPGSVLDVMNHEKASAIDAFIGSLISVLSEPLAGQHPHPSLDAFLADLAADGAGDPLDFETSTPIMHPAKGVH